VYSKTRLNWCEKIERECRTRVGYRVEVPDRLDDGVGREGVVRESVLLDSQLGVGSAASVADVVGSSGSHGAVDGNARLRGPAGG
jgi:hypothetical protein